MVVGSGWEVIMEKKKIFIIVENHELLEGIAQQFEKFSNYQIVGTANSAGDAITFFKTNNCDLLRVILCVYLMILRHLVSKISRNRGCVYRANSRCNYKTK